MLLSLETAAAGGREVVRLEPPSPIVLTAAQSAKARLSFVVRDGYHVQANPASADYVKPSNAVNRSPHTPHANKHLKFRGDENNVNLRTLGKLHNEAHSSQLRFLHDFSIRKTRFRSIRERLILFETGLWRVDNPRASERTHAALVLADVAFICARELHPGTPVRESLLAPRLRFAAER